MNSELPHDIGQPSGLLTDGDIRAAVNQGFLLTGHEDENVRYSSYELRTGRHDILSFADDGERHTTPVGANSVRLEPGQTARVWAAEEVRIPTNVLARVTTVGQIFSTGLAAENTFADPGYDGPLYVTLSNISHKVLTIPYGEPLARIEFYRLGKPVDRPHAGGGAQRPSFVQWATPERLSVETLGNQRSEDWLKAIAAFGDSERYDWRHCAASHVATATLGEMERLRRSLAATQLALYVLACAFTVGVVAWLFARYAPTSVRTETLKWLVPTACGAILTTVGFAVRSLRRTARDLVANL
jgi:deoxycytidine triphosphate deaminase